MKKIYCLAGALLLLSGCGSTLAANSDTINSLTEQTVEQLRLEVPENETQSCYEPLNFDAQRAMWFTYMDYKDILYGKSESEYTESIKTQFENAAEMGINTIYFHVSAFNDGYYNSSILAKGQYCPENMDFDPLEIAVKEAHSLGISIHAWINPLRCGTDEQIQQWEDFSIVKKWYSDSDKNGSYIVKVGERWYLNPAYEEVREYICSVEKEILENYQVDGIHIDDYFYPSQNEEFDSEAFALSGESSLEDWRFGNIDSLVSEMYSTVKGENEKLLFGISPQGNMDSDYNMYADVEKWCSQQGFCDYIVPQIYYGYENEVCPFTETAERWSKAKSSSNVSLVIGICTYKIGSEDQWAGNGIDEWKDTQGIPAAQAQEILENSIGEGIAVYSYESTFKEGLEQERSKLSAVIKEYGGSVQ